MIEIKAFLGAGKREPIEVEVRESGQSFDGACQSLVLDINGASPIMLWRDKQGTVRLEFIAMNKYRHTYIIKEE